MLVIQLCLEPYTTLFTDLVTGFIFLCKVKNNHQVPANNTTYGCPETNKRTVH